jgi:hypothetical protein
MWRNITAFTAFTGEMRKAMRTFETWDATDEGFVMDCDPGCANIECGSFQLLLAALIMLFTIAIRINRAPQMIKPAAK